MRSCCSSSSIEYSSLLRSRTVVLLVSVWVCVLLRETEGFNFQRITPIQALRRRPPSALSPAGTIETIRNSIARIRIYRNGIGNVRSFRSRSRSESESRLVAYSKSVGDNNSYVGARNIRNNNNSNKDNNVRYDKASVGNNGKSNGSVGTKDNGGMYGGPPNVDAMVAHAGKLRQSIREQQIELQRLENQLICCTDNNNNNSTGDTNGIFTAIQNFAMIRDISPSLNGDGVLEATVNRAWRMFMSSNRVLFRKLARVRNKTGPNNQRWESMSDYVATEMATIPRIVSGLVQNPDRIKHLVDPSVPTLLPHVPAILSRLDKLESHVAPILERVLNNRQHLGSIEPYLPEILERFDDIEPHLAWILDNIDALAPNTGLLLKHIDELLLYADCRDYNSGAQNFEEDDDQYALAMQLLPYLEYYVSRLDVIGPHLPLLRPHVPLLLKYNRIGKISPHIDKLFARGYKDLSASVNMDVLLFWFGWTLRIPGLPRLFFALPKSPWIVSLLANRLPKRFVRGSCSGVQCCVDNDYGYEWNNLQKDDDMDVAI